jgi:predicted ATP-dependent endonuclease of OLD family
MKLSRLKIENVLSYKEEYICFNDNLNIFVGPNGGGKSNLLNIIIYILKKYCFKSYGLNKTNNPQNLYYQKYHIEEKSIYYGKDDNLFLSKHKNFRNEDSRLIAYFNFDNSDYTNLLEMLKYKNEVINFLEENIESISDFNSREHEYYQDPKQLIIDFFNINRKSFKRYVKKGTYKITLENKNNKWIIRNKCKDPIMMYMRSFAIILDILDLSKINYQIKKKFMFFEAYRNNSQGTTIASISNNNGPEYQNYQTLPNMKSLSNTIGINTSYITQATIKYGHKLREYLEIEDGISRFNNDLEFMELRDYFKKFGYDIKIKCLDINNNTYQFYLIKNGSEIEIDLISTGERELVNFIFGLFSENLEDGIIIIDEPELHLHPNWQKKFIEIFKTATKNRNIQLLFSTHSATFINYDILNDIYRIHMNTEGISKYVKIYADIQKNDDLRKILNIVNATNNEKIFFSKSCVLVEGITDEVIFKKIFRKLLNENVSDLEVININGKGNYKKYKFLLEKLQIPNFYIGDRDNLESFPEMQGIYTTDEHKLIDELKKESSTDYAGLIDALKILRVNSSKQSIEQVLNTFEKIEKRFVSESELLSDDSKRKIEDYIINLENDNIYLLKRGEIEKYIGVIGHDKVVSFKTAIDKTTTNFENWQNSQEYLELESLCNRIIIKLNGIV